MARIREQEEKERAIAAELRQKAQAIREASRPKALDVAKVEPFFTLQLLRLPSQQNSTGDMYANLTCGVSSNSCQ